jgi:hypothetical protein
MSKCKFYNHDWDKWGDVMSDYNANKIQFRRCKNCGKIVSRKLGFFNAVYPDQIMNSIKKDKDGNSM